MDIPRKVQAVSSCPENDMKRRVIMKKDFTRPGKAVFPTHGRLSLFRFHTKAWRTQVFGGFLRFLAFCALSLTAMAASATAASAGITADEIARRKASKLPAALTRIYGEYAAVTGGGLRPQAFQSVTGDYQIRDGHVVIDASSDDPAALLEALRALGLKI